MEYMRRLRESDKQLLKMMEKIEVPKDLAKYGRGLKIIKNLLSQMMNQYLKKLQNIRRDSQPSKNKEFKCGKALKTLSV